MVYNTTAVLEGVEGVERTKDEIGSAIQNSGRIGSLTLPRDSDLLTDRLTCWPSLSLSVPHFRVTSIIL